MKIFGSAEKHYLSPPLSLDQSQTYSGNRQSPFGSITENFTLSIILFVYIILNFVNLANVFDSKRGMHTSMILHPSLQMIPCENAG